jgi:transcriptional regulator with XRE-family HTH domain
MNATAPGEALRAWRTETHRTQASLADELGVFQEDVSMFERGGRRPSRVIAKFIDKLSDGKVSFVIWFDAADSSASEPAA